MKFLNFLKPKPTQPTIDSYGQQSSGVEPEQMQLVMEWLFASLLNAGYCGKSHLMGATRFSEVRQKMSDACGGLRLRSSEFTSRLETALFKVTVKAA
jgi:hypothetical protein